MKTDSIRFAVMRALNEGHETEPAIKAFVADILGRPAPGHTMVLVAAIRCARAAVAGEPCDGTKRSRAYHLMLREHSDEEIALKLHSSTTKAAAWRVQLGWVCEAGAARTPRKRAKASISWANRRTAPPLRRSRRAIWEYIMDVLADGYDDLDEITLLVQTHVDEKTTRRSVESVYMLLVSAKLALDGYSDNSQGNRIARALLAWRGNSEAALECEAPVKTVAGIRSALRRVDAGRVPLDPTFHLQPADQEVPSWVPAVGGSVPWAPPPHRPEIVAEGRPLGIKAAAKKEFVEWKSNVEVLATLRALFPSRNLKIEAVAQLRAELRRHDSSASIPTDLEACTANGRKYKASGRENIGVFAKQAIRDGGTDEEVLKLVRSKFRTAKTTLASIQTYRSNLRKSGENIPTDSDLKKRRMYRAA